MTRLEGIAEWMPSEQGALFASWAADLERRLEKLEAMRVEDAKEASASAPPAIIPLRPLGGVVR